MKAYVITIIDNPKSVKSAKKCIESGAKNGLTIEMFGAFTPADKPWEILDKKGISPHGFVERYSRLENCMSCFCPLRLKIELNSFDRQRPKNLKKNMGSERKSVMGVET